MEKLKPCPFCGGKNIHCADAGHKTNMWFIQCEDCGATFPHFDSEKEANEAWNRREELEKESEQRLESYLPTDSRPFSGTRTIDPPIKVQLCDIPDSYFRISSMLGNSKEEWFKDMADAGIHPNTTYLCSEVEGFGDVADIKIDKTDTGASMYFMADMFETAKGD